MSLYLCNLCHFWVAIGTGILFTVLCLLPRVLVSFVLTMGTKNLVRVVGARSMATIIRVRRSLDGLTQSVPVQVVLKTPLEIASGHRICHEAAELTTDSGRWNEYIWTVINF